MQPGFCWPSLARCILFSLALVEDLVGRVKVMGYGGENHSTEYQGRTKTRSAFWKGPLPAARKLQRREKLEAMWEALVVVPARAGRGLSQVENNREVSQQDLEVNWMQVLGRRGGRVTTGSSQGPAGSLQLGETES